MVGSAVADDSLEDMNDITLMSEMVCEFELDSGFKKRVQFSQIYFAFTIFLLGLLIEDGELYCDSDETLCSEEKFNLPPISKLNGYKSMSLYMRFLNDTECRLDLTPVQMAVIVVAFDFRCDEKNGIFTCLSDEIVEEFINNPQDFMADRNGGGN